MGTLRSTQTTELEEGIIVPTAKGLTVNGVLLGEPVELDGDPTTFEWDDSAFTNGIIEVIDGEVIITPDEDEITYE